MCCVRLVVSAARSRASRTQSSSRLDTGPCLQSAPDDFGFEREVQTLCQRVTSHKESCGSAREGDREPAEKTRRKK